MENEDGDWVTLPGPAEWWPEDFDYAKYGFDVPGSSTGYVAAWAMLT